MLDETQFKALLGLSAMLSQEQKIWASGFLAGQGHTGQTGMSAQDASAAGIPALAASRVTFAYATETGNAKKLAADFASRAKSRGVQARLVNLEQYRFQDLPKEEYLFTVISTQGDGEPPVSAMKFFNQLDQAAGSSLGQLKYSVLALGDSSYPEFCKAGENLDEKLNGLGAKPLVAIRLCDTDYAEPANAWFDEILQSLQQASPGTANPAPPLGSAVQVAVPKNGQKTMYTGRVLATVNLNASESQKHTQHLEISAEGVFYQPGDSLGIIPANPAERVAAVLALTGADGSRIHEHRRAAADLHTLLQKHLNINHLSEKVVKRYAEHTGHDIPDTRMGLVDLLKIYPASGPAQFEEIVHLLEGITPRLYSIASSPQAHPDEIHLTVARDVFVTNDEKQFGLCSDYLLGLNTADPLEYYIHTNSSFRLPPPERDMIMIGPGTGVAPFRSFLWEREAQGASGRNWLFFGDRSFVSDFLYQTEFQSFYDTGLLTRLNTAFSRDQQEKLYVQQRMLEQGQEVFSWIAGGASVYICGARYPMSADVEAALVQILEKYGKTDGEAALEQLKETERLHKDVY